MKSRKEFTWLGVAMISVAVGSGCGSPVEVTEDIEVPADGAVLAATIDFPSGDGPFPLIVFGHGSGQTVREGEAGNAVFYAGHGFAVVRYDKRGVGESTGQYVGVGTADSEEVFPVLAADLAAVVDHFSVDSRVDASQIVVIRETALDSGRLPPE